MPPEFMHRDKHTPVIIWLLTGCVLIYFMMVIGAITRLTQSGLSMVHWSFTGSLPPLNASDWELEFNRYKSSPEFQLLNSGFSLADFKSIFWWEYIHRFLGRTIGVVFLIPYLYFQLRRQIPSGFQRKLLLLLAAGAMQGLIGWFMVLSGLQDIPHVSHFRLAIHLLAAFSVFGLTFWFALDLIHSSRSPSSDKRLKRIGQAFMGILMLQIVYGAFVAGLKAGYLYPTFPKMGDYWIAEAVFTQLSPLWRNFVEGQAGVQFIHRCLAIGLILFSVYWAWQIRKHANQPRLAGILLGIVLLQFSLGLATLVFHMPIALAVAHQTGAFALFACTLFLLHRI